MAFACIAHLGLEGCSRALRLFFGPAVAMELFAETWANVL